MSNKKAVDVNDLGVIKYYVDKMDNETKKVVDEKISNINAVVDTVSSEVDETKTSTRAEYDELKDKCDVVEELYNKIKDSVAAGLDDNGILRVNDYIVPYKKRLFTGPKVVTSKSTELFSYDGGSLLGKVLEVTYSDGDAGLRTTKFKLPDNAEEVFLTNLSTTRGLPVAIEYGKDDDAPTMEFKYTIATVYVSGSANQTLNINPVKVNHGYRYGLTSPDIAKFLTEITIYSVDEIIE
jgi:hypothetical protein